MSGTEQQIDSGAEVVGSDGEKIGSVGYVVVRPAGLDVTDLVVNTGSILGRDVVVPIDRVDRVEDGKVYLKIGKDEVQRLPDYVEVHYQQPPAEWVPPGGFYYPPGATLWPAESYYPEPASVKVNAPAGTVGVRQGMDVKSSDGHKVGSVDGLDVDPQADTVTAIVVKEGFLFTHEVRISVEDIAKVDEEAVTLNLTEDEAQRRFG